METNTLNGGGPIASGAPIVATPKPEISSDFETFLKMLTVQMQNQDPLNPVDSSDYAVQLATFSGVEQQVQTNDLLRNLATQMGAGGMADLASWVGMEARTNLPVAFAGTPVGLSVTPDVAADAVQLIVIDDQGTEVQRLDLNLGDKDITWAGVADDGGPLPNGDYRFEVANFALGQEIGQSPATTYARVTEVQTIGGQSLLVLQSGATVAVSDVTAVREPPAS